MFDKLSQIQIIGIFVTPIVLLLGAIVGPKHLRHSFWGGLIILLSFYFINLFK